MNSKTVTHADLVERARRWLLKATPSRGACSVVLTEIGTSGVGEIPDAVGWWGAGSYLVECKATVEDWRADAKKVFRNNTWKGVGLFRYFLVPEAIADKGNVPDGWGLLVAVRRTAIEIVKEARPQMENPYGCIEYLLSTLRRLHFKPDGHVSVRFYEQATKSKATATISTAGN